MLIFIKININLLIVIISNSKLRRVVTMKKCILLFCVLLAACGTGVAYSHRQNGVDIYTAQCNGIVRNISSCYQQASQTCSGNFEVIHTSIEDAGSMSSMDMSGMINPTFSGTSTKIVNRSIMFFCKWSLLKLGKTFCVLLTGTSFLIAAKNILQTALGKDVVWWRSIW